MMKTQTDAEERLYWLTFAPSHSATTWTDARSFTWSELCELFTTHEPGPKDGASVAPAVFRDGRRAKANAEQIDVLFLDIDAGHSLDEIVLAVEAQGWAAIISSTHSHRQAYTRVKREHYEAWKARHPEATPGEYLVEQRGFQAAVAEGAWLSEDGGEYYFINHQPCPKFRVIIPLAQAWQAVDFATQEAANVAWREFVLAVGVQLSLSIDEACTDTSRLYYLPRYRHGGPPPEARVIEGRHLSMTAPSRPPAVSPPNIVDVANDNVRAPSITYTEPETGEVVDLVEWARLYGAYFELARALRRRAPHVLTGLVRDGKHHVRCPNEEHHTEARPDGATFVMDASSSTKEGFVVHCRHAHCDGHDRLLFVRQMLEQGWISVADLTDFEFLSASCSHSEIGRQGCQWIPLGELPKRASGAAPLDPEIIPEPLRRWCVDTSERLSAPLDYVAAAAVVIHSALVGRRIGIKPKAEDDWLLVANLWGVIVGRPSTKKTPALKAAVRPTEPFLRAAREEFKKLCQEYGDLAPLLEAQAKDLQKRYLVAKSGGDTSSAQGLRGELAAVKEELRESAPKERRFKTNDSTVEKLAEIVRDNPHGVLLLRDEIAGFFELLSKPGREGDRAFYLEAWNGDGGFTSDRIGRGTTHVEGLCVSILGGIQPSVLAALVGDAVGGGAGDDGLMQRFQVAVYPDSENLPEFAINDRKPDVFALERVEAIVTKLWNFDAATMGVEPEDNEIPAIRFSPEAQEVFNEFWKRLEQRIRSAEMARTPAYEAHLAKYVSLMPSLALIFHMVQVVDDTADRPQQVSVEAARLAVAWCDYLETHAKKLYSSETNSGAEAAHLLAAKILDGALVDDMSLREIKRAQWRGLTVEEDVWAGLKALEAAGWVQVGEVRTRGGTSQRVRLHPDLRLDTAPMAMTA